MEEAVIVQKQRINSIDILRGIIMIIMALDHVRDYTSNVPFNPLDLSQTSAALFLTRWITHFCAPTFIFLSGVSAYLSLSKKKTKKEAALFLLKRGLWLIFLEITVIGFGWQLDIGFHTLFAQVIWVIGWSMILLSVLIYFKPIYVASFGLILIFGHNLFDHIQSASFGNYKLFWMFLHEQSPYQVNSYESIYIVYPLIPWVGLMAVGYAFGIFFKLEPSVRRQLFIKIGLGCLLVFVVMRYFNIYGDPVAWQVQTVWWKDILAFIKCQKQPPSLLFILMTIGPSIIALGLLERSKGKLSDILIVYGRVPMFYYILHVYLVRGTELIIGLIKGLSVSKMLGIEGTLGAHGFNLPVVYLIWLSIVLVLYFPCRWYMRLKQTRKDWWLSYL